MKAIKAVELGGVLTITTDTGIEIEVYDATGQEITNHAPDEGQVYTQHFSICGTDSNYVWYNIIWAFPDTVGGAEPHPSMRDWDNIANIIDIN